MVELSLHSYRLSQLLAELDYIHKVESNNDFFSLTQACEWLDIASSIENVNLLTAKHDYSIMFCSSARDYEDKRSLFLSEVATQITIFNFIWGAFETIVKVINPKFVPKKLKKRRSITDDAIYYLKKHFDPKPRINDYNTMLYELVGLMRTIQPYKKVYHNIKYEPFLSITGVGLHIVRIIRNEFAHGSADLPPPQEWGPEEKKEQLTNYEKDYVKIIELSSRILLLSIQMLLYQFLYKNELKINFSRSTDAILIEETPVKVALRVIQEEKLTRDINNQLTLF